MPKITDISVTITGNVYLFFILICLGVGVIYYMYRSTLPPVRLRTRIILAVIRFGALGLIVSMLFAPVFTVSIEQAKKPLLAVLVDTSASMGITEKTVSRPDEVRTVLTQDINQLLSKDFDIRYFAFNRVATAVKQELFDTLRFSAEGTDISSALKETARLSQTDSVRGIILLSDGNYNLGENPVLIAEKIHIPVYSVGIGSVERECDVLISNVQYNEIMYTNTKNTITVSVQGSGFTDASAEVTLLSDDKLIEIRIIQLPDNYRERAVTFSFTPEEAKTVKLTVSVPPRPGETNTVNNKRDFFIKVLESKIQILLVSGRPNQDFPFLLRSLESNDRFSVTSAVQRGNTVDEPGKEQKINQLHQFNVFILIDFPNGETDFLSKIRQEIIENKKPLLYIRGAVLTNDYVNQLADIIPLSGVTEIGKEEEIYLQIPPQALNHPVMRLVDDKEKNTALWQKLPPVYTSSGIPIPAKGAEVLGVIDPLRTSKTARSVPAPVIIVSKINGRKGIFINAYNLWRWKLMAQRDASIENVYDTFFENCTRWLSSAEDSRTFSITPNKEFYKYGEQITINAQVYTETYEPLNDAAVRITVQKGGISVDRILQSLGEGKYSTTIDGLESGEYKISGFALKGDQQLGTATAQIMVGSFSFELMSTSLDSVLLLQISSAAGGKYFNARSVEALSSLVDDRPVIYHRSKTLAVSNTVWLLSIVIVLLCIEWFIRKRLGML